LWAELVGEGFYEPIDDLGPDRKASAPHTLQLLADEFASHGYDVKWLFRTITATKAYQRESRPRRLPDQIPFAANCVQRLRGDQLYSVLASALGSETQVAATGFRGGGFGQFGQGPRFGFNAVFGFDPSARREEITGSIPQALLLMNSRSIDQNL